MFNLPKIDFSKAIFFSGETIEFHYGRHHKTYIDNLNSLVENRDRPSILELIETSSGSKLNNVAQAFNHTFYWLGLTPEKKAFAFKGDFGKELLTQYDSIDALREKFIFSASHLFGSGWTWLACNRQTNEITVINTKDAGVIDFKKYMPLFVCDIWEHAYYIEYRNSRINYLQDFWGAINWEFVEENFKNKDLKRINELMT